MNHGPKKWLDAILVIGLLSFCLVCWKHNITVRALLLTSSSFVHVCGILAPLMVRPRLGVTSLIMKRYILKSKILHTQMW